MKLLAALLILSCSLATNAKPLHLDEQINFFTEQTESTFLNDTEEDRSSIINQTIEKQVKKIATYFKEFSQKTSRDIGIQFTI